MAWPDRYHRLPGHYSPPIPSCLDGRMGFMSVPLRGQSCVLNVPGFSGDLWLQGLFGSAPNRLFFFCLLFFWSL